MSAITLSQGYRWLFLLVALSLIFNILAWFNIGLLPDEAYYWIWSQRLEAGYFDHPSLVAWVIRPFTEMFGSSAWAIRLPSVLTWLLGAWLAYDLGERLYGRRSAGLLAMLVWASLPIVQIGFHIVTPDTPMLLFGWLSYYFACRAVMEDRAALWALTGLAIGLAVAGKYPGAVIAIGLFLALPLSREGRRYLRTPWPWLAILLALLAFAPVIWWNAERDWISFAFQLGHGIEAAGPAEESTLELLLLYLGGQLGVAMPWTLIAMLYAALFGARRLLQAHSLHYPILLLGFLLPLLIFGAAALTTEGHPNWPVSAYIPGTLLLAGVLDRWLTPVAGGQQRSVVRYALIVAFVIPLVLVNLLRFPHWLEYVGIELPSQRTQLSQSYGWQEVKQALLPLLQREEATNPYGNRCIVIGNKLQTASMLGFLLGDADRVTAASDTRLNQFHLWQQEQPVPPQAYCLYFEQFAEREAIPATRRMQGQGEWRLSKKMEVKTPDLSSRWYAFYTRTGREFSAGASSSQTR
jgi:hypothetical protein